MWQRHNAQLANFDVTSLRVISFAHFLGCRHIEMSSPVSQWPNEREEISHGRGR